MTVGSLSMNTVKLLADKVTIIIFFFYYVLHCQILMTNKLSEPKIFWDLTADDRDLTMFTISNLTLAKEENRNMVYMAIKLKRKVVTELVTTYFPTILLLLITFTTIFFDKDLFGDAIAVNLTIMLVMTTIFTSKIEELPPTSDMKMIDIWLIFCLVVPFLEVILRTALECVNCNCHICEPEDTDKDEDKEKAGKEDQKIDADLVHEGSSTAWTLTGAKVAPQQVKHFKTFYEISSLAGVDKGPGQEEDAKSEGEQVYWACLAY